MVHFPNRIALTAVFINSYVMKILSESMRILGKSIKIDDLVLEIKICQIT